MKMLIICLVIFFNQFNKGFAQKIIATSSAPLFLVDTFVTDRKCLILDEKKILSVDVYKDSSAIKIYGNRGKNGVVLIHTKEKVNFLRMNALFEKFDFPDSLRNYRVCIDEVIVERPDLILADESEVSGLSTFAMTNWVISKERQSEKFINISTKKKNL